MVISIRYLIVYYKIIEMKLRFFLLFLFIANLSYGIETNIIVRAKAKDAKFVGSSLGGAYVIIKDKLTGRILDEGRTEGTPGDTELIMENPVKRGTLISDENTSKFLAAIDIDEPTFVTIDVYSPINSKQAQVKVSTELWLIPGKDILGDGIILEIPGYIIDVLTPRTHQYMSLESLEDSPLFFKANIVMMCGCPIQKDGLWDSENIEVKAIVKKDGEFYKEVELENVATNLFESESSVLEEAGQYEVIIYAYDESTGNTGVDKVNFVIFD